MASSEEEIDGKTGDTIEWDVDMEVQLFYAMANHKPVGINKHFHMACIWEKLSNSITKEISTHGDYILYYFASKEIFFEVTFWRCKIITIL